MVTLLNPTGEVVVELIPEVPPLATVQGARIGFLDNTKHNADLLLGSILDHLVQHRGALAGPRLRKDFSSSPASAELIEQLAANCDAVLVGTAD